MVQHFREEVRQHSLVLFGEYGHSVMFFTGYGNMVPRTRLGQGVFIIYALFGLPLTMITLKYTGQLLMRCILKLISAIEKNIFGKDEPTHLKLKSIIVSLFWFIILHVYTAFMFKYVNKISYIEGLYASFVTFSTIGFGDYSIHNSIGKENLTLYVTAVIRKVFLLPLILIDLSVVSCLLNSIMFMMENMHNRLEDSKREETAQDTSDDTSRQ